MNKEQEQLVAKAVKALQLQDIVLFESRLSRPNDIASEQKEFSLLVKQGVSYNVHKKEGGDLLLIKVELGVRLVDSVDDIDETKVFVEIEADYIVQYRLLDELDETALSCFADYNAVHNVWPFWRQHVFDLVQRSRLPHINIPLFYRSSE